MLAPGPSGIKNFNPRIFSGRDLTKSRDFSGRDFPIFFIPGFYWNLSGFSFLLLKLDNFHQFIQNVAFMCSLKALSKIFHLPHQSQLKCVFKVSLLNVLCWYFQMMCKVTSVPFVWLLFSVSLQMRSQIARLKQCKITLVTFVWPFPSVLSNVSSNAWIQIGCICFFCTMCFQMCPHCQNILASKGRGRRSWPTIKCTFTLYKQIPKNPGI